MHIPQNSKRKAIPLREMSAMPHQPPSNVDDPACPGDLSPLKQLFCNPHIRRRIPTETQFLRALAHAGIYQGATLSIRQIPILSSRRIWLIGTDSPTSLSRAFVWTEPPTSRVGRHMAKRALSLWHLHSRVSSIRRRIYQQHNQTRRLNRQIPGIFQDVSEPRYWFRCCGTSGFIPSYESGMRISYEESRRNRLRSIWAAHTAPRTVYRPQST